MTISSRTPEGRPNRCPVCRRRLCVSPSWPGGDAPCPRCGCLVWFPPAIPGSTAADARPPADFTLEDFRKQLALMGKMSSQRELLARMPGMGELDSGDEDPDVGFRRVQGMLDAMTVAERANPDLLDASRRSRIASGAGVQPKAVDHFLEQFGQIRGFMRQMAQMSMWQRIKMITDPGEDA